MSNLLSWNLAANSSTIDNLIGSNIIEFQGSLWCYNGYKDISSINKTIYKSTDGYSWSAVGTLPSGYTAVTYGGAVSFNNQVVLFGGGQSDYYGDGVNQVWYSNDALNFIQGPSATWQGRELFSYDIFNNEIWLFAGIGLDIYGTVRFNDIWKTNNILSAWTQITPSGDIPEYLEVGDCPILRSFDSKLWIFGGGYSTKIFYSSDGTTWTLYGNGNWTSRRYPSVINYGSTLYMMGGYDNDTNRDDLWYSDNGTTWIQNLNNPEWGARWLHQCVSFLNKIWIFPGLSTGGVRNNGIWHTSVPPISGDNCNLKENYITICGPDMLGRFGDNRNINLVNYLPDYLRGAETEDFLILFENFLNNMYDGLGGWQLSSTDLSISAGMGITNVSSVSAVVEISSTYDISGTNVLTTATDAQQIKLNWPINANLATSAQKISILEKVQRLTELHDPDLMDIEYIQFFAANLGYNINISRDEVGNSGTNDNFGTTEIAGQCSASDINRYLRFVVSNLPSWYKIKTTDSCVKVMLYSFGLIGDIIEYFTNTYETTSAGGRWVADFQGDLSEINKNYFPTPHFAIYIDIDKSSDISFDIQRRQKVIRAIESIQPINTVFRKIVGYFERRFELKTACYMRTTRYFEIKSNGYSNGWSS